MSRPAQPLRASGRRSIPALTLMLLLGGACWRLAAAGPDQPAAPAPDTPVAAPTLDATPDEVKPDSALAPKRIPRTHGATQHRTLPEKIDAEVRRLAVGLNLDAAQQEKLRQILWDQHRELRARLVEHPQPGVDRASLALAIVDHTKAQIRAMLNDEQKVKYSAEVPREAVSASRADLEHWVDVQNGQASQDAPSK